VSTVVHPPHVGEDVPRSSSPYQGLRPYAEDDWRYFFGRDRATQIVRGNLVAARLTVLYAPSGVGKTSLLRAGVAHSLRATAERASRSPGHLPVVVRSWSTDPIAAVEAAVETSVEQAPRVDAAAIATGSAHLTGLAATVDRAARVTGSKVLLILDQFEEFLLYHGAGLERDADDSPAVELARLMGEDRLRANILIAIREDALAQLDRFKARVPRLLANRLSLGRLDREAGTQAAELPLAQWNAEHRDDQMAIDPELTRAVLAQVSTGAIDLGRGSGGVGSHATAGTIEAPFLQLVLGRLWEEERAAGSPVLRRETLAGLGGATEIVKTHLDRQMTQLSSEEQDIAAAVFHRLVTPSGAKVALRIHDLAAWTGIHEPSLHAVLHNLSQADRRIVRAVPHPTHPDAPPSYEIFHDVLTEPVLDWRTRHETQRQAREMAIRAREEARRRWRRRLRLGLLVACTAVVAVIAVLAVIALQQAHDARTQSRAARSGELAANALAEVERDPDVSALLALEALRRSRTPAAEAALRAALASNRSLAVLLASDRPVADVDVDSKGERLLAFGDDGHVRVWRAADQTELLDVAASRAPLINARFSPDGARIVTSSRDGSVAVRDAETGGLLRSLRGPGPAAGAASWDASGTRVLGWAGRVAVVWDGFTGRRLTALKAPATIAAARWLGPRRVVTAGRDGVARVWDLRRAAVVASFDAGHPLRDVRVDDGGAKVLTIPVEGSATVNVWEPGTGSSRAIRHPAGVFPVVIDATFDHSGARLATAGADNRVWIWDARTGTADAVLTGHGSYVIAIEFSGDGSTVATAGNDGSVRTWDAATGVPVTVLRGHDAWVSGLAFLGRDVLASAGSDGSVRLWRPTWPLRDARRLRAEPDAVSLSRSGRLAAAGTSAGVELLDMSRSGASRSRLLTRGETNTAAFSPDEKLVVVARANADHPGAAARVLRVPDGRPAGPALVVRGQRNGAVAATFSANGRLVLTSHRDGAARLWDARSHRLIRRFGRIRAPAERVTLLDSAFSDDGRRVATVGARGIARLFDTATGREVRAFALPRRNANNAQLNAVALQPHGRLLATAGIDSLAVLWDPATGQGRPLGHDDSVLSVAFSGSGELLATASADGTIRLWDTHTAQPLAVLTRESGQMTSVAFSADEHLLTADQGGVVRTFACEVCGSVAELERRARDKVDGAITPAERQAYLGSRNG
jgi:WD40 repeat protein